MSTGDYFEGTFKERPGKASKAHTGTLFTEEGPIAYEKGIALNKKKEPINPPLSFKTFVKHEIPVDFPHPKTTIRSFNETIAAKAQELGPYCRTTDKYEKDIKLRADSIVWGKIQAPGKLYEGYIYKDEIKCGWGSEIIAKKM